MHSGRSCGVSDPILKHAFLAGGAPIRKRWFLHTYRRKCVLVDLQDEQYTRIYTQIHDNIQQVVSSLLAYNTLIQQRLFETYGRQEAEVTVNVPLPPDEHLKKLFAPMIRSTVDGTNVRMLFWLKHAFAMLAPTFLASNVHCTLKSFRDGCFGLSCMPRRLSKQWGFKLWPSYRSFAFHFFHAHLV